jgi:hypothetical protein
MGGTGRGQKGSRKVPGRSQESYNSDTKTASHQTCDKPENTIILGFMGQGFVIPDPLNRCLVILCQIPYVEN